jgi:hypothetical protein
LCLCGVCGRHETQPVPEPVPYTSLSPKTFTPASTVGLLYW